MTIAFAKHLVQKGLVSGPQMDDVLQRRIIYGGSIDTNLLEIGLLEEKTLMHALSELHGVPAATPELITGRDERITQLFPARLAEKYQVVPVAMTGRSLVIIAAQPIHPMVTEEINFMLSLSVRAHIVTEVRLRVLMHHWLGIESQPRYLDLSEKIGAFPGLPQHHEPKSSPEAMAAQEALQLAADNTIKSDRLQQALSSIDESERQAKEKRERARTGKISLEDASRACEKAQKRDQLVDVILRYSRQFMEYVGLFVINNDVIFGWDAVGTNDAQDRIKKVHLPVASPSVLKTVIRTRAYYLGPIPESGNNNELLQAMGRKNPRNALIVPIPIQNRLIGLLFGDAGPRSIKGNRIQELLVFVSRLSTSFEKLIRRTKKRPTTQELAPPVSTQVTHLQDPSPLHEPQSPAIEIGQPTASDSGDLPATHFTGEQPSAVAPSTDEQTAPREVGEPPVLEFANQQPAPTAQPELEPTGEQPAPIGLDEPPVPPIPDEQTAPSDFGEPLAPQFADPQPVPSGFDEPPEPSFPDEQTAPSDFGEPLAPQFADPQPVPSGLDEPPVPSLPDEQTAPSDFGEPPAPVLEELPPPVTFAEQPVLLNEESAGMDLQAHSQVQPLDRDEPTSGQPTDSPDQTMSEETSPNLESLEIGLESEDNIATVRNMPQLTKSEEGIAATLTKESGRLHEEQQHADPALSPAVSPSKLDLPAVVDELSPDETPVRIENLDVMEVRPATIVDTDQNVVSVESSGSFPQEQAETPKFLGMEAGLGLTTQEELHPSDRSGSDPRADVNIDKLVESLISADIDLARAARKKLLSLGPEALHFVKDHFPGHLLFNFSDSNDSIPPVQEHAELLALLVDMGVSACPIAIEYLEASDPLKRYYAVALLGTIQCESAVDKLSGRLYDREAKVRLRAIDTLQAYRGSFDYEKMLKRMRNQLQKDDVWEQQAIAAALLGNFKDVHALPALVDRLKSRNKMVARACLESLSFITKQDFGNNQRKWIKWWRQNKGMNRVQWLIMGLMSKNSDIRFSSAQELNEITGEYFDYYFDSSKADREKAAKRWEEWWQDKGRHLHFD